MIQVHIPYPRKKRLKSKKAIAYIIDKNSNEIPRVSKDVVARKNIPKDQTKEIKMVIKLRHMDVYVIVRLLGRIMINTE